MSDAFAADLDALIARHDFVTLRNYLTAHPLDDLIEVLERFSTEHQAVLLRLLPRDMAATAFEELPQDAQEHLLKAMAHHEVAMLLNDMSPDDRTELLEELPASMTKQMLALLTSEERAVAVTLLGYPEDSIGRLMTPDYIVVRKSWSVGQVLDFIREHGRGSETLSLIFVVDEAGILIDDIRIREFLFAARETKVADLMDHSFVALKASDHQESAVVIFREEHRMALPVTDSAGILLGIVTIDDVLAVAEEEATEDMQKLGAVSALDKPYMQIPFVSMIKKRAGWLVVLFIGEMLTATAMGFFEAEIERAVVLALFVPLIISSGGNAGSQASTLVIRAMALGEVRLADWWRVMRREIGIGLSLGLILGTIGIARISLWSSFSNVYGPHWALVAITVGTALVATVLWGTISGSMLPLILRRLGLDPATSSAPFVATLVDVTGLILYFSIGMTFLRGTLL